MLIPILAFLAGKELGAGSLFGGPTRPAQPNAQAPLDPFAQICPVDATMPQEDRDATRNAWARATAPELIQIASQLQPYYPVAAGTLFHKAAMLASTPKAPAIVPPPAPEPTPIRKTPGMTPANGKASVIVDAPAAISTKEVPEDLGIQ